jgi:hypothetical protein
MPLSAPQALTRAAPLTLPLRTIRAGGYVVQDRRRLVSHLGRLVVVEVGGVARYAAAEVVGVSSPGPGVNFVMAGRR